MADKVVPWFHELRDGNRSFLDTRRERADLGKIFRRVWLVFVRNLGHYADLLEPLKFNPDFKFQEYYMIITFTIFLFEETGGVVYDDREIFEKVMLLSFIDQIVDHPEMGISVAYGIGFYVFRGVKCGGVPPALESDVEHVKNIIDRSPYKSELFKYMTNLGKIEKKLAACKSSAEYRDHRLHSNCQMLWDMFDWGSPEIVFAINCAGVITDDLLDLVKDTAFGKVYLDPDNTEVYISVAVDCVRIFNRWIPYDLAPYLPFYAAILRAVAVFSFERPDEFPVVLRGSRVCIFSFLVLGVCVFSFRLPQ